jgi:hypothetical protein
MMLLRTVTLNELPKIIQRCQRYTCRHIARKRSVYCKSTNNWIDRYRKQTVHITPRGREHRCSRAKTTFRQVNLLSFCERIYSSKTGQKNLHIECKDVSTWPLCDVPPLWYYPLPASNFTRIEFWPSSREQMHHCWRPPARRYGGKHVDARPSRDFIRGIRQEEENPTRRGVNGRAQSTLRLGA